MPVNRYFGFGLFEASTLRMSCFMLASSLRVGTFFSSFLRPFSMRGSL